MNAKDQAIEKVKDNNREFYELALRFAQNFVATATRPFSSEDVREKFYQTNEKPREERVWGAVMAELQRRKVVFHNGYQRYKNPAGHSRPSSVWIKSGMQATIL